MTDFADPAVATALLQAARSLRGGTEARTATTSDGYLVDVAVRRVRGDDRRHYVYFQTHRIAVRVDLVHARARGLPVDEASTDALFVRTEHALDALFTSSPPVLDPHSSRIAVDDVDGQGHVMTKGRHRTAMYVVRRIADEGERAA